MGEVSRRSEGLRRTAVACFSAAAVIGLLVMIAWASDQWRIAALGTKYIPTAPSTALLLVLLGAVGVLLNARSPTTTANRLGYIAATGAVTTGMLVWGQSLFGFELPVEGWLALLGEGGRYARIALLDPQLNVKLSFPPSPELPDESASRLVAEAVRVGRILFSDLYRPAATGNICLVVVVPILLRDLLLKTHGQFPPFPVLSGRPPVGALLLVIDPQKFLFPLIQSWPMPSATGESLLVRREGEEVLFLNELRHRRDSALLLRLPLTKQQSPAVMAASGKTGLTERVDYRGVPVLAALRAVADTPWTMVTKIDETEVYAALDTRTWAAGIVTGLVLMASCLGAVLLWSRRRTEFLYRELATERERKALDARIVYPTRYANDIILMTDQDWNIVEANERAVESYGYSLAELRKMKLRDLRAAEAGADFDDRAREVEAHGRSLFETLHQPKGGPPFPVEVSARCVEIGGHKMHQSIIRDISERKRQEAQILRLNTELEQRVADRTWELDAKNRELETFTYSVSHDLKAPLRGIDGYSRLLLEDHASRLNDEGRMFVHTIRAATDQMTQLIDDLLAYSRLERRTMVKAAVDPRALVQAVVAERAAEAGRRGAELVINVPSLSVNAEAEGLLQALRNLLDNALKFTRDVRNPHIEIGGRDNGGSCTLWVRDNGPGFDMQYHDRIFDIFQRLHRAEEYPGTGVGLAIVRRAMERMGGRAWAESAPGQGATFYVEIPQ